MLGTAVSPQKPKPQVSPIAFTISTMTPTSSQQPSSTTTTTSLLPPIARVVPNRFPRIQPGEVRLAVIGEAPSADDTNATNAQGLPDPQPFVGTSGRLLRAILANCGVACDQLFFGNVCQYNPSHNDPDSFDFNGPEVQSGLSQLRTDLHQFRPNCCLLLGKTALRAFRPDLCYQSNQGFVVPLSDWRGSIFNSPDFGGYKCVATYHPAFILRSYGDMPLFKFDVGRAVRHGRSPHFNRLVREGTLRPTLEQVLSFLDDVDRNSRRVAFDIEGYADDVGVTMVSFCTSPTNGIVIPFWLGGHYWREDEEVLIWQAVSKVLANPRVAKIAHNGFYELFVLAWRHHCVVNNLADDTMMKHWEIFPEAGGDPDDNDTGKKKQTGLGRSLALCASIYTEEPYYKAGRLSEDHDVKLRYNLTDSQVTFECSTMQELKLSGSPKSFDHYRFNINLIPPLNYIMLRGCRFDIARAKQIEQEVIADVDKLNSEIRDHLGRDFNVKSTPDKQWLLYDHLKYTPLKKYGKTTKEDVLLHYWTKEQHPLVRLVIRCVRKRTRLSDIHKLLPNVDGRIRSTFDPVGTNTGRLSSKSSQALEWNGKEWDNTGTNLQNVTKELRVCFVPDSEDYDFWQFDLSGADGWTVAADLAVLGHPAMLEDYLAGIKPALVLYYMLQEQAAGRPPAAVNRLDRTTLKNELRRVKSEIDALEGKVDIQGRPLDWQYLCCKRVQHGSNYGARPEKIAEVVFGDSDGTIVLSPREATVYQSLYKLRYNTDARNDHIRRLLSDTASLTAACGITRQFFGIRSRREIDDSIVREAAAFTPQANTTWSTNKALERLWYSIENRTPRGWLFVEPLLQIHDALAGQYKKHSRDWAHEHLKEWFNNPITISGTKLVIPADGKYGENWKDCKHSITH